MSRAPLLALGLVATALAGVITWELAGSAEPAPGMPAAPDRTASPRSTVAAPAGPAPAGAVTQILARPLFSPDRRPAATAAAAGASEAPLPRLTGVLVTADGRSALFAGVAHPLVIREGEQLGRFTVRAIEPGLVTIQGSDGLRVLRPMFDPARPVTVAASPQPGTPAPPLHSGTDLPPMPPPVPGTSPGLPDGSKDAMPFDKNPAPSGQDILRIQATRVPAVVAPSPR